MKINILSGSYKIIKSGSIIADEWASDIKFQLCPNAIISMTICLHFEEREGHERSLNVQSNTNTITFVCVNFGDTVGTSHPIEIGKISGKRIYFNFRNYEEKRVMRKIEYTFYEEV